MRTTRVPGLCGKKQAVYAIADATVSKEDRRRDGGVKGGGKGLEKPSTVFLAFHRASWFAVRLTTKQNGIALEEKGFERGRKKRRTIRLGIHSTRH